MNVRGKYRLGTGVALALGLSSAVALAAAQPQNILPSAAPVPAPAPAAPVPTPSATPTIAPQLPVEAPVLSWTVADARSLLGVIEAIEAEGLIPADYQPTALRTAIAAGPGAALDAQAAKSFGWLIEDMRDGRTRIDSRLQWFAIDTDVASHPTAAVMAKALEAQDIAGAIADLAPVTPDYAALKGLLAITPKTEKAKRNLIRANMDRWRWLQRDLGKFYLLTNVPEFQLRLTVDNSIIKSYRTVVGKVGKTATPQLAEVVEGVIFNPTWTVPQSIVKGEGLGARLVGNPAQAAREGYKVTKAKNGMITVVQQPGARNALGYMKLDMPNEHAIFVHDTPSRGLFGTAYRALSHGCIRTEKAVQLGMTMAILGSGKSTDELVAIVKSGEYTRVPMTKTFPIYITYFTMATDINGKMGTFADLYSRDAPVLASFAAPRQPWYAKRKSAEKVIKLDNPL